MATINGIYVFVEDEDFNRSSTIPQHPVEKGLPITDNVKEEPKTLNISGKIVAVGDKKAETTISEIEKLRTGGSLIKYIGRNVLGNFMIRSFDTSFPHSVWGGANFSMELVEVRIAKSAYDPSKQKKAEEEKKANNPTIEVGAIVVFKGGSVYVSSDATKAAANRERQTCKITLISRKSWSKHQIHLISTEKVYPYNVYGWVDEANIEGAGSSSGTTSTNPAPVTTGGTKQPTTTPTPTPPPTPTKPTTQQTTPTTIGDKLQYIGTLKSDIQIEFNTYREGLVTVNNKTFFKAPHGLSVYSVAESRYITYMAKGQYIPIEYVKSTNPKVQMRTLTAGAPLYREK